MIQNYLKLAFKVLARKKFYTFISLFGISFTLMMLMVTAAYMDNELGAHAPLSNQDRMLLLTRIGMEHTFIDTTYVIDSTLINGQMVYDSTENIGESSDYSSTSSASYSFLDRYCREVPYVQNYTFFNGDGSEDLFLNSKKLSFSVVHCDERYWEVFDFQFLAGRPFTATEVQNQAPSLVISRKARDAYFGVEATALGKEIVIGPQHFTVVGIVENVPQTPGYIRSDLYMPLTHTRPGELNNPRFLGRFNAAFLAEKAEDVPRIEKELARMESTIPLPNPEIYNVLKIKAFTLRELFAVDLIYREDKADSMRLFYIILGSVMFLFMLLPTLNLINVNVTRIMERSSEIGVRKAFGAHTGDLLFQFVFENILLTFIGGILGLVFAYVLINILNASQVLEGLALQFHASIFLYAFLICLIFGILSGVLPAWRMARLHIVSALKAQTL